LPSEKRHGLEVKEFDDFDFMAGSLLLFDKKQMQELDQYKTYFIEIQKMRLIKINETPHQFIFTDCGIKLRGSSGLTKRIVNSSPNRKF
jgi:circadian clock protein KaiC